MNGPGVCPAAIALRSLKEQPLVCDKRRMKLAT